MCATGPDFASAAKSERDMIGWSQHQIPTQSCCIFDHIWVTFGQLVNLPERVSFNNGDINPSLTLLVKLANTLGNDPTQQSIIRCVTQPATASAIVVISINSARDIGRYRKTKEQSNRK
jgi:hypothetical protein